MSRIRSHVLHQSEIHAIKASIQYHSGEVKVQFNGISAVVSTQKLLELGYLLGMSEHFPSYDI